MKLNSIWSFVIGLFHLMLSRFIRVQHVSVLHSPFYCWIMFYCIDIPHFIYPFISWWAFGLFLLFWLLWNIAAMNICVQVFCRRVFSILLVGNLGVKLLSQVTMFNLLSNWQCVFQSSCTVLSSHQRCMRVLISPHLHHDLLSSPFLITAILVGV